MNMRAYLYAHMMTCSSYSLTHTRTHKRVECPSHNCSNSFIFAFISFVFAAVQSYDLLQNICSLCICLCCVLFVTDFCLLQTHAQAVRCHIRALFCMLAAIFVSSLSISPSLLHFILIISQSLF